MFALVVLKGSNTSLYQEGLGGTAIIPKMQTVLLCPRHVGKWPAPEVACLSGWVLLLSFPVTSPRPSSSVYSVWQLLGFVPEISAASRLGLRPLPSSSDPQWAEVAVSFAWAAFVGLLLIPEEKKTRIQLSNHWLDDAIVVIHSYSKIEMNCNWNKLWLGYVLWMQTYWQDMRMAAVQGLHQMPCKLVFD